MKDRLDWDENATEFFMQGLSAWIDGYPHVALAFWLPSFESALRSRLANFGEDVVNPEKKMGIENFVMFDGLLTKALIHYDERTVEYWRLLLSTRNGLGWNLRSDFCHGVLPIAAMRTEIYSLAMFIAYLLLLYPTQAQA